MLLINRELGLFSDEVFTSTDLNRRSAGVLNSARKHPVTIVRNDEQFALIRRDQAAGLMRELAQVREIVEIFRGVAAVKVDLEAPSTAVWVACLDEVDQGLMLQEIFQAYGRASSDGDWDQLSDLIYQWKETAAAANSGVIDQTLQEAPDEQPLPAMPLETSNPE